MPAGKAFRPGYGDQQVNQGRDSSHVTSIGRGGYLPLLEQLSGGRQMWAEVLSVSNAAVLGSLAIIHLYWAVGGFWPGTDRVSLKAKVLGGPATSPSPNPAACMAVVAALIFACGISLQLGMVWVWLPPGLARLSAWAITLALFLRGSLGFVMARFPFWRSSTEFNRLNQRVYSPLCLMLAIGFVVGLR